MPAFDRSEYLARIAATKKRMAAAGIEVLFVTSPQNMNYLTGYDGWSFYTHQMVVLSLDAELPIWVGRGIDVPCAELTVFMGLEQIRGYPDHYVQSSERHEMDFFAAVLKEAGLAKCRLGVEMENYYFTAKCYERLKAALPDAVFRDASGLVNWIRINKSPREIEYMTQAGEIADRAMQAGFDAIEPGVRQCDAAAQISHAQISGTAAFGGDVPQGIVMGTGEKAKAPHLVWTDQPYESDEATTIELGACRHRYHVGLARTLYLGKPPDELRNIASVVLDGLYTALDAVEPGKTCEEIEAAWRSVIRRAGYDKESRIGYSIGLGYPPDWGEHTASLRAGDRTELMPDMTFHMILGMWQEPVSFVVSETFRIVEGGQERFSRLPPELLAK